MSRKIRVTTTSLLVPGGPTKQDNLEKARALLERACASRPEIVCLPETVTSHDIPYADVNEMAESVPGPFTEMAAEFARRYETYIICPVWERRHGRVYNSAVLLDRQGRIAGTYDKLHPVTSNTSPLLEKGVTPGNELKVFDTDFGRIGILICFDINWRQEWARLKEMGAEIVFWPSAYDGGLPLQARALDHHYFVVSAVHKEHARIIDMLSSVLVETGPYTDIAEAVIDLDKKVFSTDFNLRKLAALRLKYGRDVTIDMRCDEDMFSLESQRQGLSVADLMAEYGMQTWSDYIAQSTAAQDAQRLETVTT
jgi:predicted amidohydrolase